MSSVSEDWALPRSGTMVCQFVVKAGFAGKEPFYVGNFHTSRCATMMETEAAARRIALTQLRDFLDRCFPDPSPCPDILDVSLGAVVFVADDYEWRRT